MRITFNEVAVRATKRWTDPVTGKRRQQTRKFYQTINPFNKGTDGLPKSREQIIQEITAERDEWLAQTGTDNVLTTENNNGT